MINKNSIFAKTKYVFFVMKKFNSNFNDGTGELNIQYEGTAGTTEAPVTSDCNCGEDRTVQVNFITDDGEASKTVTVNQEGVREQFIPADQTEGIRGSDGELFLGVKEEFADAVPDFCKPKQDYLVYTTTSANQSVKIINRKQYAQRIYLEDGTELDVSGTRPLNYTFPNAGEHKVWIELKEAVTDLSYCFNECTGLTSIPENLFAANTAATNFRFCFYKCTGLTSIPENLFTNNTVVTEFGNCFYGCSGLTSIPENLFTNNTVVTEFSGCFQGCSGLTGSIPKNLFTNNTVVTDFSFCFYGCSGLTSIPENLFAANTAATDFRYCFKGCSGLTSIPSNLFANNTAVTNFGYCFHSCSGLTSIPSNLFTNNTAVTIFGYCFQICSGLTSIPENLFAANMAVTNFSYCFDGCTNITSSCPIDNDGTPIYNRSGSGKDGYALVSLYSDCFFNCTKMADYASIPSGWK